MSENEKAIMMTKMEQLPENGLSVPYSSTTGTSETDRHPSSFVVRTEYDNDDDDDDDDDEENQSESGYNDTKLSNEYVLNVAFFTFVGFLTVQVVFALIAHSQAMLADSEAMAVDAVTYLFNLVAEKIKKQPLTDKEQRMPPKVLEYRRDLRRLYLELIPPALSVMTLIFVTIITLQESIRTLRGVENGDDDDDNVSVGIMLIFSGVNLVLDFVNVSCFARANSLFGLGMVRKENVSIRHSLRDINLHMIQQCTRNDVVADENTALLSSDGGCKKDVSIIKKNCCCEDEIITLHTRESSITATDSAKSPIILSNLNMCSAWTHICADTLRSTAVLIAAGIAFVVPAVDGAMADSVAAIIVSIIILGSLIPLIQGLVVTALEIIVLHKNPPISAAY